MFLSLTFILQYLHSPWSTSIKRKQTLSLFIKIKNMSRTSHCLFLLVLTLSHGYSITSSNVPVVNAFERFDVFVLNQDIENLIVHVYSKDNDLGNKTMTVQTRFDWKFRESVGDSTVFEGEFYWLNPNNTYKNTLHFNVFDKKIAAQCGQNIFIERKCFWFVNKIGFYFAKDEPKGMKLIYRWL